MIIYDLGSRLDFGFGVEILLKQQVAVGKIYLLSLSADEILWRWMAATEKCSGEVLPRR